MTDIVDRLRAYAEVNEASGLYTEANCAWDAIEEIERLRKEIEAQKDNPVNQSDSSNRVSWDRTGDVIRGTYTRTQIPFTGKVVGSRVEYGGSIVHTVELFFPIKVFGVLRDRIQVYNDEILT